MGYSVSLTGTPQRIISLVPSDTELLFDLGVGEKVVGITDFCIHPAKQLTGIPSIGGPKQFDFTTIDALQPDLIIGNKEENYEEGIEQLREKYPVWMSDITTLDQALEQIERIAQIVGRTETGKSLAENIKQGFKEIRPEQTPKTVAYVIWNEPLMVAGGQTFINTMLGLAGYENIFKVAIRYPQIRVEDIQAYRPDLIFLASEPYPFTRDHQALFQQTFPQSKVLLVDGEIFAWYGSHLQGAPRYFQQLKKKTNLP